MTFCLPSFCQLHDSDPITIIIVWYEREEKLYINGRPREQLVGENNHETFVMTMKY